MALIAVLLSVMAAADAQEFFKNIPDSSSITIKGTSTLHDWEMEVTKFESSVTLDQEGDPLVDFKKATLSVQSTGIISHSALMDKKAWNAINAEKFPVIEFNLSSPEKLSLKDNKVNGSLKGSLTVAGVSREINVDINGRFNGNDKFLVTGSSDIDMTRFGVAPPTAMLGALKTGDRITIDFRLEYKRQ